MNHKENFFEIENQLIGLDHEPYCIAEVGINHNGDINLAKKMIDAAKRSGADAVKFQTFKADELCGDPDQLFTYKSQGKEVTEPMLDMFRRYELANNTWEEIKKYCKQKEITFFSTPQNISDLEVLMEVGIPAIKIGSDDLTNTFLIKNYSKTGLPLILSCGMSDLSEVHVALEAGGFFAGAPIAMLLCTSQYPTPPKDINISKLNTLREAFPGLILGFSDHSEGYYASCMAVAMGARIFEKHFTLDKNSPGPDHWFSEDEKGLSDWVSAIKKAGLMIGSAYVRPTESELEMRVLARRSIVALRDIKAGETFDENNLGLRRCGVGLSPSLLEEFFGMKAYKDIAKGIPLTLSDSK